MVLGCVLALVRLTCADVDQKIDHVVVLMMENRAFDHMLGSLALTNSEVDGCTPEREECWNPEDPLVVDSPRHQVNWDAVYEQVSPGHSIHSTTEQIYGQYVEDNTIPEAPNDQPAMKGFIKDYVSKNGGDLAYGNRIMEQLSAEHVPVITTLANEFAVFDGWFAAVPGPTMVNRAYAMSATSDGMGTNNVTTIIRGMPQSTIFKQMLDMGLDYKVYFSDGPTAAMFKDVRRESPKDRLRGLRHFYTDAASGDLPELTWLEPAYFDRENHAATDQHPDHDVSAGEDLIRDVYNALRASPVWERTAFIITYDEHGGFYDHVSPPENVPNPDGKSSTDDPFKFDRLGVRIPTVIVSPWVAKGTVHHAAAEGEGQYEHSSLVSTIVHKLFKPKEGMPEPTYLTKRDAWAATFEDVFSLNEPRQDTPADLTPVVSHRALFPHTLPPLDGRSMPLSDLQLEILSICAGFGGHALGKDTFDGWTEEQSSDFCMKNMGIQLSDVHA